MAIPVAQWVADARAKLTLAEHICNDANTYITTSNEKLQLRNRKVPKLLYFLDALQQQIQLLTVIRDSLVLNLNSVMERRSAVRSGLLRDVDRLQNTISVMKNTTVVFDGETSLFDYISEAGIEDLFADVEQNIKEIDSLVKGNRTDALLIRLSSDLDNLNNEMNTLISKAHDLRLLDDQDDLDEFVDPITKLLEINNELENEMVGMLTGFNNHYDQCEKGQKLLEDPSFPEDEKEELVTVLENDVEDLPEVMRSLKSTGDVITKNCKEVIKILDIFETLYGLVEKFIDELQQYGEQKLVVQLNEFVEINSEVGRKLEASEIHKASLAQYNDDFQQFIRSYYSLIVEVDRRAQVNQQLTMAINNFKATVNSIVDNDYEKRLEFLDKHGDFIPQNLIDPQIINSTTPQIEIAFDHEPLPPLTKDAIQTAKKFLR
ncbi:hypothetical protein OGAPHI_007420 [Ogataea philodendri]|uniref:Autophagy-related protein 17 n=1 Tax=Ogataea philodendri TaxID=1378263 RepID=A0A9P8SZT7_9ASCO|nr:uncharacterized protein OGAPHI_007420 [Ogataea philodendri]KAH3660215.1 hypothetical protein OGAPHI_007420 [Ogataea philodendri]